MLAGLRSLFEPAVVPTTLPNRPGRVYKGRYPYWQPQRRPYWEAEEDLINAREEEELLALMGIDLD